MPLCIYLFIGLGVTPVSTQGLVLALCQEITLGGLRGPSGMQRIKPRFFQMQGSPTCCGIAQALKFPFMLLLKSLADRPS